MKKGKKMPSIELEGHSEAKFVLVDGKIVRMENTPTPTATHGGSFDIDRRFRE
jgi:hypothetical protein